MNKPNVENSLYFIFLFFFCVYSALTGTAQA